MHKSDCAVTFSSLNELQNALEIAVMLNDQRGAIIAISIAFDDEEITALLRKIFKLDEM